MQEHDTISQSVACRRADASPPDKPSNSVVNSRRIADYSGTERAKFDQVNIHASSAARHLAPLLQALNLSAAVGLVLALHEIVIEGLAAVADEVRRTGQIGRSGSNLLHLGDVIRHGCGVHEDMLVESDRRGIA